MARSLWLAALLVLLAVLPGPHGTAQEQQKSASDLIRRLTYQDDQSDNPLRHGLFTCGSQRAEIQQSLPVYEALVRLGPAALPAIEETIRNVEESGQFVFNFHYLLWAYARIKGSSAFPRLRVMFDNPVRESLRTSLDEALALSLGLTSYVSSSRLLMRTFSCTGVLEPRQSLDQLILAWEQNNREWVEAGLGPDAKAALKSLLEGRSWEDLRADIWRSESRVRLAVGYRFEAPGWWSQPVDANRLKPFVREPGNPEVETIFTDASGEECGRQKVKFLRTMGLRYEHQIDNVDLRALLGTIASCAAGPASPPR